MAQEIPKLRRPPRPGRCWLRQHTISPPVGGEEGLHAYDLARLVDAVVVIQGWQGGLGGALPHQGAHLANGGSEALQAAGDPRLRFKRRCGARAARAFREPHPFHAGAVWGEDRPHVDIVPRPPRGRPPHK